MSLTHLFDVELEYDPDAKPIETGDSSLFPYVGSGAGTVSGPGLKGELRWSFYEQRGEFVCRARRTGVIETSDGATIELEELGYFGREDERTSRWSFAGGVRFKTEDERYRWLTSRPALLEGGMDLSTGHGRLRATALDGASERWAGR